MSVLVKICGVRRVEDAVAAADAGAGAVGLNFWRVGPRYLEPAAARAVADAVRGRLLVVGVFVDAPYEEIVDVDARVGLDRLQLHGGEPPELVARFAGKAYKALRVSCEADLAVLSAYGGPCYLLDTHVPGQVGGTGRSFDWALAAKAKRYGRIVLAGGLTSENVAEAVRAAQPYGVDVASGVETAPGVKDPAKIAAFVAAVRGGGGKRGPA